MDKKLHAGCAVLGMLCLFGGELRLKGGSGAAAAIGKLQDGLPDPGKRLIGGVSRVILQYWRTPGPVELAEIGEVGGSILAPVPDDGVLVLFPDGAKVERLGGNPGILKMAPEWKVSPLIGVDFSGRMVVEFFPDVTAEQASTIVTRSGLVEDREAQRGLAGFQKVVRGGVAEARMLAQWNETGYVFPAQNLEIGGGPACVTSGLGGLGGRMGQYVASSGATWTSVPEAGAALGYFIEKLPEKVAGLDVEGALAKALQEWERFALLRFAKAGGAQAERTISLRIASGAHGDAWPFDGPGAVLAHAFYPAPLFAEPQSGDIHLDLDEQWTEEDLYSVLLHELGHALGLAHSDDPTSVMYPMYRRAKGLAAVDIATIRGMYGVRTALEEEVPSVEPAVEISEVRRNIGDFPPGELVAFSGHASGSGVRIRWRYASRGGWNSAMGAFEWIAPVVPLFSPDDELIVEAYDDKGGIAQRRFRPTKFPEME